MLYSSIGGLLLKHAHRHLSDQDFSGCPIVFDMLDFSFNSCIGNIKKSAVEAAVTLLPIARAASPMAHQRCRPLGILLMQIM